jgi:hypothetical protein
LQRDVKSSPASRLWSQKGMAGEDKSIDGHEQEQWGRRRKSISLSGDH